jgi:hypothetical protein
VVVQLAGTDLSHYQSQRVHKDLLCAIIRMNCRSEVLITLQITMTCFNFMAPLAVLMASCGFVSIMLPVRAADPNFESLFKAGEGPLEIKPFHRSREIDQECRKYLQFHDETDQGQFKSHRAEASQFLTLISYPYFTPNAKLLAALKKEGVKLSPPSTEVTPLVRKLMIKYKIKADEIDAGCNVIRKRHDEARRKKLSFEYSGSICATTFQWLKKHEGELKEHNLTFENVLNELGWGQPVFLSEYLKGPFNKRSIVPSHTSVTTPLTMTASAGVSNPALKSLAADYSAILNKHWPIWLQDRAADLYWHDIYPSEISKYPRGAWPRQST